MGVSYYACESCGESCYEEYVGECIKCDATVCTDCLVNREIDSNFAYEYGYVFNSENVELMKKYIDMGFTLYKADGSPYYDEGDIIGDSGIDEKYCPYCSGNEINKDILFNYIVEKYKLDVQAEWKELKGK